MHTLALLTHQMRIARYVKYTKENLIFVYVIVRKPKRWYTEDSSCKYLWDDLNWSNLLVLWFPHPERKITFFHSNFHVFDHFYLFAIGYLCNLWSEIRPNMAQESILLWMFYTGCGQSPGIKIKILKMYVYKAVLTLTK